MSFEPSIFYIAASAAKNLALRRFASGHDSVVPTKPLPLTIASDRACALTRNPSHIGDWDRLKLPILLAHTYSEDLVPIESSERRWRRGRSAAALTAQRIEAHEGTPFRCFGLHTRGKPNGSAGSFQRGNPEKLYRIVTFTALPPYRLAK